MSSLLKFNMNFSDRFHLTDEAEERYSRDALGDLKHGLDLIFKLKDEIDKLHPIASEVLIKLLSN